MTKKTRYERTTQYNSKIHTKTKGGLGFGMKKGVKSDLWETSGGQLADVFGWELPPEIKKLKDAYMRRKKRQKKNV